MNINEARERVQEIRDGKREEPPLSEYGVECFRAMKQIDLMYDMIEKLVYDEVA